MLEKLPLCKISGTNGHSTLLNLDGTCDQNKHPARTDNESTTAAAMRTYQTVRNHLRPARNARTRKRAICDCPANSVCSDQSATCTRDPCARLAVHPHLWPIGPAAHGASSHGVPELCQSSARQVRMRWLVKKLGQCLCAKLWKHFGVAIPQNLLNVGMSFRTTKALSFFCPEALFPFHSPRPASVNRPPRNTRQGARGKV